LGHGAGNLLEIGDAPLGTIANQGCASLKCRRRLRIAPGLPQRRHAALRLLPFHLVKIQRLHKSTRTAIHGGNQAWLYFRYGRHFESVKPIASGELPSPVSVWMPFALNGHF